MNDDPLLPPFDEGEDTAGEAAPPPADEAQLAPGFEPAAQTMTGELLEPEAQPEPAPPPARPASRPAAKIRPDLADSREPLYRECRGYRLRLDPPDLARLRELPGSRGKSDSEIGEAFFDGQAERLAASIADDVPSPSEVRVVVDPYSRQAFLALENKIRGILSF
jgi:hypothetical protein